jgi:hypothetical protein
MVNLNLKKILLFVPNGKGIYGSGICSELEKRGAIVHIYDERPSQSTIVKITLRLFKNLFSIYFQRYILNVINTNCNVEYDYVLIIRGEAFTPKTVNMLKANFKTAKFILYLWDSVAYRDTSKIFQLFDSVLSFDEKDVATYPGLKHRADFYLDDYKAIANTKPDEFDVVFVGTMHNDRYPVIMKLDNMLKINGLNSFYYFYFPSKLLFWKRKIFDKSFKSVSIKSFQFKMISAERTAYYMSKSKASLDIQGPSQVGLTMRTIETIGAQRKLITSNISVKTYDFYNKNNIFIIDRNNPTIDPNFFKTPYIPIDEKIYYKYSLQCWIDDVFAL